MFKGIHAVVASSLLLAGLVAVPASAALTASSAACSSSTVTTGQAGYVACLGSFDGNMDNQLSDIYSAMTAGFGFTTATYFASQGFASAGNPFAQDPGALDNGSITFDAAQTGSFVIGLKQANAFSLYLFNGAAVSGGISGIVYDDKGVNGKNSVVLSHAGFFGTPVSAVPEADTYAMLLAGLGMMAVVGRRRKTK